MGRIATSRAPNVRGVWIWPWLPGIGIPHVQVFLPASTPLASCHLYTTAWADSSFPGKNTLIRPLA